MKAAGTEDMRATRTCVGCGRRDGAAGMVRLAIARGEVVCDSRPREGRGAYVHPVAACILRAPRALSRAFRERVRTDGSQLGRLVAIASGDRMVHLLLAARRRRALAVGVEAASIALDGGAPLAIVAADAGITSKAVDSAIVAGRAVAWGAKTDLGAMLGVGEVDVCAVRDERIASDVRLMRAAIDAGIMAAKEGEECSKRPEAR